MEEILNFMKMRAESVADNAIARMIADIESSEPVQEQDQKNNSTG